MVKRILISLAFNILSLICVLVLLPIILQLHLATPFVLALYFISCLIVAFVLSLVKIKFLDWFVPHWEFIDFKYGIIPVDNRDKYNYEDDEDEEVAIEEEVALEEEVKEVKEVAIEEEEVKEVKEEVKEAIKEAIKKEEVKEEVKEAIKEEVKEEVKEAIKEEVKEAIKEEEVKEIKDTTNNRIEEDKHSNEQTKSSEENKIVKAKESENINDKKDLVKNVSNNEVIEKPKINTDSFKVGNKEIQDASQLEIEARKDELRNRLKDVLKCNE